MSDEADIPTLLSDFDLSLVERNALRESESGENRALALDVAKLARHIRALTLRVNGDTDSLGDISEMICRMKAERDKS